MGADEARAYHVASVPSVLPPIPGGPFSRYHLRQEPRSTASHACIHAGGEIMHPYRDQI
jgi:hypothetical protein